MNEQSILNEIWDEKRGKQTDGKGPNAKVLVVSMSDLPFTVHTIVYGVLSAIVQQANLSYGTLNLNHIIRSF